MLKLKFFVSFYVLASMTMLYSLSPWCTLSSAAQTSGGTSTRGVVPGRHDHTMISRQVGAVATGDNQEKRHLKPKTRKANKIKKSKSNKGCSSKKSCSKKNKNPVTPTTTCQGNCTLPTGAILSAFLDMTNSFDGIVGNQARRRFLKEGGNIRRHLQDLTTRVVGTFPGSASISEGNDGVHPSSSHFTYVIDVSGSTFEASSGCPGPNVIDCELGAIQNVNTKLAGANLVTNISIVAFDDDSHIQDFGGSSFAAPIDPRVGTTLQELNNANLYAGSTNFVAGLEAAYSLAHQVLEDGMVTSTSVIFITDRESTEGPISEELVQSFVALRTKVYTFAIGEGSSCSSEMINLSEQTPSGECAYLTNPADLAAHMEKVFFADRSLMYINVTLDGWEVPISSTGWKVPPGGRALTEQDHVDFSSVASGLPLATDFLHNLCVEAATNASGDSTAKCCIKCTIDKFVQGPMGV